MQHLVDCLLGQSTVILLDPLQQVSVVSKISCGLPEQFPGGTDPAKTLVVTASPSTRRNTFR